MNQSNQEPPKERQEQPEATSTTKNSLSSDAFNVVDNPREFVENPAVAPPPLDTTEDLRVDLFKD